MEHVENEDRKRKDRDRERENLGHEGQKESDNIIYRCEKYIIEAYIRV